MRKCPKTIDTPFLFVGLEIEEMCILILVFYYVSAISYLLAGLMLSAFAWAAILKIKKGKPRGALIHFLYKLGMPLEGFIPSVKKKRKLSVYSKKELKRNI